MKSIEILARMNENKKEHTFSKADSVGNLITVVNTLEEAVGEEEIQQLINNILRKELKLQRMAYQ